MREILTTTAAEAGRTTRFVQRTSPLNGATFSQTLVCGFLGNPQAPLEALTHTAAALGVEISPQALEQRFTASAAACLPQVLLTAIARVITAEPVAMPLLQRFTAVSGHESSTIVLPAVFAAPWHGCGGSTASSASAALKLQARVEMRTGRLDVQLQEGRASDRTAVLPGPLPAGAVRLAALGSWSLEALAALEPHQVFWLSRLQRQTAVYEATGDRRELLELLETQATDTVALAVALGERQHLAARLLAVRVPQDGAELRRRRLRAVARDTGRQVRATRLALAAWTLCRDAWACRALDVAGGLGTGAHAVAACAALHVVEESGPRRRVAQHQTLAHPRCGVCEAPGDAHPTWGLPGQLVGLSRPQRDESRAHGTATRLAPGEQFWQPPTSDSSHRNGQALPRCGVSDASAQKIPEHLSTVARCDLIVTRALA